MWLWFGGPHQGLKRKRESERKKKVKKEKWHGGCQIFKETRPASTVVGGAEERKEREQEKTP